MKRTLCSIAALCIMTAAAARQPDGALDIIQTPNNGVPALCAPGEAFDAVLREKAAFRLVGATEESVPLPEITWKELPGGLYEAHCSLPNDVPAGFYSLEAQTADKTDRNVRAVFVRQEFPEYYVAAHVSDTHILSGGADDPSAVMLRKIAAAINASDAAFVLVTGDLTHEGHLDQFQGFLAALDTFQLPTFVCPGNHDRGERNYERFFGPLTYRFRFGADGYLVFDTKDYLIADDLGPQDGDLYRFRRELKPCRWTFGVTHRYEPMMGMRSQLILFVDEPLDFLLFGHWHRENTKEEAGVPWGTTRFTVVPAAKDGNYRLIDIAIGGILPRPVQNAAEKTTAK